MIPWRFVVTAGPRAAVFLTVLLGIARAACLITVGLALHNGAWPVAAACAGAFGLLVLVDVEKTT